MKKKLFGTILASVMASVLMLTCVSCSPTPTPDPDSGSTSTPSDSTVTDGNDDNVQAEEPTGSGNVMPTFASEGRLKQEGKEDMILPALNDTDYAYVEENGVATFTYPKTGEKVWETKVAYDATDVLSIDGESFNSINVHFKARPKGLGLDYADGMFTLSVDEDVTADTISGSSYCIVGSKTLTLTTQLKSTETLIVEEGPSIVVNRASGAYAINVVNAEFKKGSNITASTNGADTMAIGNSGTVLAFGNLYLKETSGVDLVNNYSAGKTGIVGFGICNFKVRRNSSRVVLEGYGSGLNAYGSAANQMIIHRSANCSWVAEESLIWGSASGAKGADKDLPSDGGGFLLQVKNSYYRWGGYGGRASESTYANG